MTKTSYIITLIMLVGCAPRVDYVDASQAYDTDASSDDTGSASDDTGSASDDTGDTGPVDADGDGYTADEDCDDNDPDVNDPTTWYYDRDGDGYGDPNSPREACENPDDYMYTDNDEDCDDNDPDVNPDAEESPYDGVDQDCNGDDLADVDGDGYDSTETGGTDCADDDAGANPDADETWYDGYDDDCDGWSDYDADGDGYDSDAWGGDDCDDTDDSIYPEATETQYDGIDSNCDGANDYDADGDGYEYDVYNPDYDADGGDCDDTDSEINPEAWEINDNGIDENCNGLIDAFNFEVSWNATYDHVDVIMADYPPAATIGATSQGKILAGYTYSGGFLPYPLYLASWALNGSVNTDSTLVAEYSLPSSLPGDSVQIQGYLFVPASLGWDLCYSEGDVSDITDARSCSSTIDLGSL